MHARESLRRRAPRAAAPLTIDARPRLAPGVVFEPTADDDVRLALIDDVPSSRVSPGVVDLLTAMDGETALRELRRRFDASRSDEDFLRLVDRFRVCGLLEGSAVRARGRVTYRPPFTLQIATLRAPALFAGANRMIAPLTPRSVVISLAVLLCAGLVAAALQLTELRTVLSTPVPLWGLVALMVALSLLTLLHESAHGVVLTRLGGTPRRAGIMLFYLTPAFFVDVTDGWRLRGRGLRVAVALAGPAVHAVTAAVSLLVALVLPPSTIDRLLILLAISCAAIVLINLIPFVRFDGYIALMSALDQPNLRARTISDASGFLTRLLFGGPRPTRNVTALWSVPFGLASIIAPVVLVLFAVDRIVRALEHGGPAPGLAAVALEIVVTVVGVVIVARAVIRAVRSGASRLRVLLVGLALTSTIALAGFLIPMPTSTTVGFVARGDRVVLVQGAGDAGGRPAGTGPRMPDGARAVLTSNGIILDAEVGSGTVRGMRPEPTTVPLDALFPVESDGASIAAVAVAEVDVAEGADRIPPTGQATIALGATNLWQALWGTAVVAPLSGLMSEK